MPTLTRRGFRSAKVVVSVALTLAGAATIWWSSDLMLLLISHVGEERALGANNVIVLDDGRKLLTNPGAMGAWSMPFLIAGVLLIVAGLVMAVRLCGRVRELLKSTSVAASDE